MARHAQITQNNKFAISLQYLKKDWLISYMQITINAYYKLLKEEVRDEVDILHAEPQSFLQVDFNTLAIKVSY